MSADTTLRFILTGEDRGAAAEVEKVVNKSSRLAHVVGGTFSRLGGIVGGEVGNVMNQVGDAFDHLAATGEKTGEHMQAVGTGIAAVGAGLSMLGSKDVEADKMLEASFRASGASVDDYKGKIDDLVTKNEGYAISASKTKAALAQLTQMTGSPQKALDQMGLAADLAAARNISLESAVGLVGKAMNGSTRLFTMYGIHVESVQSATTKLNHAQTALRTSAAAVTAAQHKLAVVQREVNSGQLTGRAAQVKLAAAHREVSAAIAQRTGKESALKDAEKNLAEAQKSNAQGLDQLAQKLHGQAAASTDSFRGKIDVLKTKIEDFTASIGAKFGVAIQATGAGLAVLGSALQIVAMRQEIAAKAAVKNAAAEGVSAAANDANAVSAGASAVATDAEAGAAVKASKASKIAAAAQWLLNAALDANPIGLVVLAIAALVVALVVLWKHSETARAIITAALHAIQAVAGAVVSWIASHWKTLLAILTGPIGLATLFVVSHFHTIMAGFSALWSFIRSKASTMWDIVKTAWSSTISTVISLGGRLLGFVASLPGRVGGLVSGMWHGITSGFVSAINGVIGMWNNLSFSVPAVKIMGKTVFGGASFSPPNLPFLAHGGDIAQAGAVVVGDRGPELLQLPVGARVTPLARGGVGNGGDLGTVTLVLRGEDGREIQRKLLRLKRSNGNLALGLS